MKLNENNLLGAVKELQEKGYQNNYEIQDQHLICTNTNKKLVSDEFKVENGYQFEITENAIDSQYLFTINDLNTGQKGLLIDLMGENYYNNSTISKKLNIPLEIYICHDELPIKYGMRKIFKEEFNNNPDYFELRKGYNDMPACPFGNSFKALGYDKIKKEYVWLVTSIIKDKRLKINEYTK
ncbi:hypothetical protein [Flavobacterium oreochromis]|uniref:Uncharacterized protein n=1 Tax=Flavobacterium columnare TaxID=996 RepID=A0A246GA71_9FLAO|nr:hypothetical protein [Flavobacterium oreochromis]OWP74946.1 hypothetical protein BWK62_13140 [Flavobacterium oreochromis]POR24040.1 hypothetical protein BWK58_08880 [Flavobacterium columnare]QYS86204.1 hypothetical protein JJC03_14775 [Flavobacterium oreochromis]